MWSQGVGFKCSNTLLDAPGSHLERPGTADGQLMPSGAAAAGQEGTLAAMWYIPCLDTPVPGTECHQADFFT